MKTLFICPFSPAKNASQAGHRLAFEYVSELALKSSVDVILLLRNGQSIDPSLNEIPRVNIVKVKYFGIWQIIWNFICMGTVSSFFTRYSKALEHEIMFLIKKNRYDVLRLEFSQVFYYAIPLRDKGISNLQIQLAVHDIQLQLNLRKKEGFRSLFVRRDFMIEKRIFKAADLILTISKKDANFINTVYGDNLHIQQLNIHLPFFIKDLKRNSNTIEKGSILFWGAMNRSENEDSIIEFIESTFTKLSNLNLKLYIVGANPTKKLMNYASEKIVITGFVENPKIYFERSEIGIVPLLYGAGLKLKTIEMLAAGMPVISTYIGAEGIEVKKSDKLQIVEIEDFKKTLENHFMNSLNVLEICGQNS